MAIITADNILENLQAYTDSLIESHAIPATSIAVWKDGHLQQAAAGTLNIKTGVEATTDSVFQIGSITKVMTASLVMQLVDEGRVGLDQPVKDYLQDFQIADKQASETITVRQCLNHTSGIAGDFFPDETGATGALIARYVDRCNALPLIHSPGALFSYCNSSFAIAGRLVEVLTGRSWYQAMEDNIFTPLGMDHALVNPAETLRYRAAMGHVLDEHNQWQHSEDCYLPLGMAPVGSVASMRAVDLIHFGRAHLEGGVAQTGKPWLSSGSIEAMQNPQIANPKISLLTDRYAGIGWHITEHQKTKNRFIHHVGMTCGTIAALNIVPQHNAAFAILINGFKPAALIAAVIDLQKAITGLELQEPPVKALKAKPSGYGALAGDYESLDALIQVRHQTEQTLTAHVEMKIDPLPPMDGELIPIAEHCFALVDSQGEKITNLAFVNDKDTGHPAYVFFGGRLAQRCESLRE